MPVEARIAALSVYPVKGCAGIALAEATLAARGLDQDRRWLIVDNAGRAVANETREGVAAADAAAERAGDRIEAAGDRAEAAADRAGDRIDNATAEVRQESREAAAEAKEAVSDTTAAAGRSVERAGEKMQDASK